MQEIRPRGASVNWGHYVSSGPATPTAAAWESQTRHRARGTEWYGIGGEAPLTPAAWELFTRTGRSLHDWYGVDAGAGAGVGGGMDDEPRRKRRFVVRNGDDLLVFDRQRDADAAQAAIDEAQPAQPARPERRPKKQKPAPAAALPQPIQSIPLPDLRALAVGNGMQAAYDELMRLRDLERAVQLHQALREREEAAERQRQEAIRSEAERLMAEFQRLKRRLWRQ